MHVSDSVASYTRCKEIHKYYQTWSIIRSIPNAYMHTTMFYARIDLLNLLNLHAHPVINHFLPDFTCTRLLE